MESIWFLGEVNPAKHWPKNISFNSRHPAQVFFTPTYLLKDKGMAVDDFIHGAASKKQKLSEYERVFYAAYQHLTDLDHGIDEESIESQVAKVYARHFWGITVEQITAAVMSEEVWVHGEAWIGASYDVLLPICKTIEVIRPDNTQELVRKRS